MIKKVLMFAGQGSQSVGMGKDLFQKNASLVKEANALLGYDIEKLCLGEFGDINRTLYTQVAIYFVNHLTYLDYAKKNSGTEVAFCVGHSLGEYNALCVSGAFSVLEGLFFIQKRASLMDEQKGGKMVAVLGMNATDLKAYLVKKGDVVDLANINSREQIVVSGLEKDVDHLLSEFKNDGVKAIALNVSGAFHSRYMKEPREKFSQFLSVYTPKEMKIPVVSNKNATVYKKEDFHSTLSGQIDSSVRWVETIEYLRLQGEFEYVEIANKPVLTSFLKRI